MPKHSSRKDRSRRLVLEILETRTPASDVRSLAGALPLSAAAFQMAAPGLSVSRPPAPPDVFAAEKVALVPPAVSVSSATSIVANPVAPENTSFAAAGLDDFDPAFASLLTLGTRPSSQPTATPSGATGSAAAGSPSSGGAGASTGPVSGSFPLPQTPAAAPATTAMDALFAAVSASAAAAATAVPTVAPAPATTAPASAIAAPVGLATAAAAPITAAPAPNRAAPVGAAPTGAAATPGDKPVLVGNWLPPRTLLANDSTAHSDDAPGSVGGGPGGGGSGNTYNVFVLNANNAQTLFQGVVYNDFSAWSEDLRAQVGGLIEPALFSCSWDTSLAPDAQNITVSGDDSYRLQFNWASFAGPARTEAITLHTSDGLGDSQAMTLTFLVAGTASPAWTPTPPTTAATWPLLVGSDQANSAADAVSGAAFSVTTATGNLQVTHPLPSYDPALTPLALSYSAHRADTDPYVLADYTIDPSRPDTPILVTAQLMFDGLPAPNVSFTSPGLIGGDIIRVELSSNRLADTLHLPTGRYDVNVEFVAYYANGATESENLAGALDLVRGAPSDLAPGWSLAGLTTLYPLGSPTLTGAILDNGDGTNSWFAFNGSGFVSPAGDFRILTRNGSGFKLTLADGTQLLYNAAGLETTIVYTSGLTTAFTYSGGQLTALTDPDGHVVTFGGGAITDPAGRTTQLAFDGYGDLVAVTDPDGAVTHYAYVDQYGVPLHWLDSVTDPDSNVTTFGYDGGYGYGLLPTDPPNVISIQRPDAGLETFSGGAADILAVDQPICYTGPDYTLFHPDVWLTGMDWLGFGTGQEFVDATAYVSYTYRDANALPWLQADNLARRDRLFFDSQGNAIETVLADDNYELATYNGFGEVTSDTDPNGFTTTYDYDGYGNETSMTDALGNTWVNGYDSRSRLTAAADPLGDTTYYAYDNSDRLTLTTDPDGGTTSLAYDSAGDVTASTNQLHETTYYTYDRVGRVLTMTLPGGGTSRYGYDAAGNQTTVTDPLGDVTTSLYDGRDWVTAVLDPLSDPTFYVYDGYGNQLETTDANGNNSLTYYDLDNRQTAVTDGLGHTTAYSLDAAGQQTAVTDADGNTTRYAYNLRGFDTSTTDALGHTTTSAYDKTGNQTSVTDPLGHTTSTAYDPDERVTATTVALGNTTTTAYDAAGRTTATTDALGHTSTTAYDALGRATRVTDALGDATTTAYDQAGNATSVTDALGHTTTFGFDAQGRQTSVTDALGDTTTTAYDAAGKVTATTDALGHTTTTGYDAADRQTSVTDPLGNTTTTAYDPDGNATAVTDALGHTTTTGYDADNRQISVTDPLGDTTRTAYDPVGNVTKTTDALSHSTTYGFDADNQQTRVTDPLGEITTTAYDAADNKISITDPDGNTTRYAYDAANRLTVTTDPLGYTTTNAYDADGNLTQTTDADGRTRTFTYDNDNRQTTENWLNSSGTATYTITDNYDAVGRLTAASDPDSSYAYTYDNANRLTSVDNAGTPSAPHVVINYGYDAANNKTSVSDNFGAQVGYSYDAADRVTQATLSTALTVRAQVNFGYDAADRVTGATRTTGGTASITTASNYDNANRVMGITETSSVAGSLATFGYSYDAADRVTTYTGPEGTLNYTYDATNQLTAVNGARTESYNYDSNGNRNTNGNTPGTDNRQQSDGTYNYTYDNDGNVITQTRISDGQVTTFTWDDRNRLTEAVVKTAGGTVVTDSKFVYDVNNQRIGASVNGVWTWTAYAGANAFADFNGSGTLLVHYLFGLGMDAILARVDASNNTAFYLTDNLGSVRVVVTVSGTVLDQLAYDSFGNIESETNSANGDRFKYTGMVWVGEVGLYCDNRRYYDPVSGKFISEDPSGLGPDINPDRYVDNDPTDETDPSGLFKWKRALGGGLAALVGTGCVCPPAALIAVPAAAIYSGWESNAKNATITIYYSTTQFNIDPAVRAEVQRIFTNSVNRSSKTGSSVKIVWSYESNRSIASVNAGEIDRGKINIVLQDTLVHNTAHGQAGAFRVNLNYNNTVNDWKDLPNPKPSWDSEVGATIAHEMWHALGGGLTGGGLLDRHPAGPGFIDSAPTVPGGEFSPGADEVIRKALCLAPK